MNPRILTRVCFPLYLWYYISHIWYDIIFDFLFINIQTDSWNDVDPDTSSMRRVRIGACQSSQGPSGQRELRKHPTWVWHILVVSCSPFFLWKHLSEILNRKKDLHTTQVCVLHTIRCSLNKTGNLPLQTNGIRSPLENGYRSRQGTG